MQDPLRVLVLVSAGRTTEVVAAAVCAGLRLHGFEVELGDATAWPPPPPDYDAVVVGVSAGRLRGRSIDRSIASYLDAFRESLAGMPVGMFFVGSPRRCARAIGRAGSRLGRLPDVMAAFPHRRFTLRHGGWIDPDQLLDFTEQLSRSV
jgi:hypothetical protein